MKHIHALTGKNLMFKTSFVVSIFLLVIALMSGPVLGSEIGTKKPEGYSGKSTLTTEEPISAGGGEYLYEQRLFSLGGPIPLNFTLTYNSNRVEINHDGQEQFGWFSGKFSSDTFHRILEFEDRTVEPAQGYINAVVYDENMVFKENGSGNFLPVGPIKYQLKKVNDYYYLMDPIQERVYIFQSHALDWDWGDQYGRRAGELVYMLDRNGNRLSYTYNGDYLPTQISDGLGRSLHLTYVDNPYNEFDRNLESVTDGYERSVSFTYEKEAAPCPNDFINFLQGFTDATGQTTTFTNAVVDGGCDYISEITRPLSNSHIDQTWDANGKVASQSDAYDNETTLSWSEDGDGNQIATVEHPDESERVFHHKDHRYPLDLTDETDKQFTMGYNSDDQMTSVTDRLGDSTNLAYHDESGKIASLSNAEGNAITHTYTAQDQTFTNPVNADTVDFTFYNLTRMGYPDGTYEQFTYDDACGNIISRIDQAGKTWRYRYNGKGQVLTETNPLGGVTTFTYNDDATLASSTDSELGITIYNYDGYKRVNKITHPDKTSVQIAYDLNDRITSITDEKNHTYTYTYDENGNLIQIKDPADNETQYSYDLMDRVNQVTDRLGKNTDFTYDNMNRLASVTDPNDIQTTFGYNSRNWLIQTTLGDQTWQAGYDDEGVVTSYTTPLGHATTFQTDKLGYTTGITDMLRQTTAFTRDSMTRITGISDPLDRTTNYGYGDRGLLSNVTMPVIGTATYTRNDLGLLCRITDPNGSHWTFGHTDMGRLQTVTDPLDNPWQHTYDARGRLDQTTYPDNTTLTRTYDDAGNLTRRRYSGGLDLQFTYDALDRLKMANGIGLSYDDEGRITNTENPGVNFGATYDDGGRLKTVTYNNGAFTVTYSYDAVTGLLSQVSDDLTGTQVDFAYDIDRKLAAMTRSNGVNSTFSWDNAGELTRIQDGSIIDIQYTLDRAGQVTSADMTVPLDPASGITSGTDTFTHDAASQVSTSGYDYDSRGRLTASPGHTYTWDGASRLTGIDSVSLTYNGMNDLVTRMEGGSTIHYYYNYAILLTPIVAERDDNTGQFLRYYVWTPEGSLLYMIDASDNNKVFFYHFDRTGSTLALTDNTGTVTDAYAYTPYGELLEHDGSSEHPFTFVGRWGVRREGNSKTLYHMRARYYDAKTGRFLSREPVWPVIADVLSINPYQYAAENPVTNVDPTGRWLPQHGLTNALEKAEQDIKQGAAEGGLLGALEKFQEWFGPEWAAELLEDKKVFDRLKQIALQVQKDARHVGKREAIQKLWNPWKQLGIGKGMARRWKNIVLGAIAKKMVDKWAELNRKVGEAANKVKEFKNKAKEASNILGDTKKAEDFRRQVGAWQEKRRLLRGERSEVRQELCDLIDENLEKGMPSLLDLFTTGQFEPPPE